MNQKLAQLIQRRKNQSPEMRLAEFHENLAGLKRGNRSRRAQLILRAVISQTWF